jgi:hypothetical protein
MQDIGRREYQEKQKKKVLGLMTRYPEIPAYRRQAPPDSLIF